MFDLVRSFGFAFSGVLDALVFGRNFRVQWLAGLMVLLLNNLLHLNDWQNTVILILIFAVLSLELVNCAVEKACDSSGTAYSLDKKRAKDFAAASVLLFSLASGIIFCGFLSDHFETIVASVENSPIAWLSLLLIFLFSVPIVLANKPSPPLLALLGVSLLIDLFYIWQNFDNPLFLSLGAIFHGTLGLGYVIKR